VVVFFRTSHEGDSRRLRRYAVFGYGFPAMVVVVMLGVFPNEYGNHGSGVCWLSRSYTGGIWAFAVPALLITAVNTIVFHKILRHLRTVLDPAASDKRVKTWVSATFSTVMGGTWLFAIIMLFTDGTVRTAITVIFTVLNGYCGVRFPYSSDLHTCYRLALRIDTLRCVRVKHAILHSYAVRG
jgi:hypothetical protein